MEKRFSLVIFGIEQTRLRGFCGTAVVCLGLSSADSVAVESGLRGLTRILPKIGKAARSAKASASGKGVRQGLPFLCAGPGLAGGLAATKSARQNIFGVSIGWGFNIPRSHNNGSLIGKKCVVPLPYDAPYYSNANNKPG